MGNFLVASACRAHSRSEAVYALVRAQVGALRGRQRRGSPLQRRCAAQQAALLRALSSRMALTAAVMSCWAAAATARARAALIASLVFIAKKFVAGASSPRALPRDLDDVFDEFNAVFETAPRPTRTLRELQQSAKLEAAEALEEAEEAEETEQSEAPEDAENNSAEDDDEASCATDATDQLSDLDDEYEVLPKLEEDRAFYAELDGNQTEGDVSQTEGERLLQLASSISDTSMHVEEYILSGKHDKFETITSDVDEHAADAGECEKRSIVRVLLAYCAYSEDANYSSEMVATAQECLQVWQGDEDRAFKSLAVLCSDVPRLCAALE
ncbi:N-acetyltransferase san [Phytophthora cinnamomi]|uniref:N-acetyltransferase san n=1 Tax=Phytophthora cinnamomi TaxID=4785 RepID=UPI00355A20E2|nr:N-acetyltransferase san [Phytophthora cinnamomi]